MDGWHIVAHIFVVQLPPNLAWLYSGTKSLQNNSNFEEIVALTRVRRHQAVFLYQYKSLSISFVQFG